MTESVVDRLLLYFPGLVGVFRECRACGAYKELEHFLERAGRSSTVVRSVHVCAACRRPEREGPSGGLRGSARA